MKYLNCETDDNEDVALDDFDLRAAAAAMAVDESLKRKRNWILKETCRSFEEMVSDNTPNV